MSLFNHNEPHTIPANGMLGMSSGPPGSMPAVGSPVVQIHHPASSQADALWAIQGNLQDM